MKSSYLFVGIFWDSCTNLPQVGVKVEKEEKAVHADSI